MNKKRNFDQSIFYNSFNNINPSKEVDFTLHKKIEIKNEINESIEEEGINNLNESSNQPIFNNNKISNLEKQKLIEIEKLFKKLISINLESQNQNTKENNILKADKIKPIVNNKKIEKINFSPNINDESDKNEINSNQSNLNVVIDNNFNINNIDCKSNKEIEKKSDKLENEGKSNCLEKRAMKNNKIVYINSNLDNSFSASKNMKKKKKKALRGKGKRWSKYRGVSRNGKQWQVLIMINKRKSYVGSYSSEEIAARIYDILSIKNRGDKAKTNFIYNEKQEKKIQSHEIDIKSKNINEVISNLLKED